MSEQDEAWAQKIADATDGDPECDHINADEILVELLKSLGYVKTVEAWEKVAKWYS